MFEISFKRYGPVTVATVQSSHVVDQAVVSEFGDRVIAFLEDHDDRFLLVNLSHVEYLSSTMLSELMQINTLLRRREGSVRLCGLKPAVRDVFAITNLDDVFEIHDDCKACLQQFRDEVAEAS